MPATTGVLPENNVPPQKKGPAKTKKKADKMPQKPAGQNLQTACWVCNGTEHHWRTDLYPKHSVGICKQCGSVQFYVAPGEEEKIKEFYRKDYRTAPGANNIITTTHKLNYIKVFLGEYLSTIKGQIKMADIGAATGYLCDWFKKQGHLVTGTELTPSFRRFSEHFYGVPLTEEITDKHRYNLIVFYHTLEHMIEPRKKLEYHASLLAEGGHILISVPEWFNVLENLAAIGQLSIDNYFHKNHVYSCSRQSMHNLFNKCGLQIVKEDYQTYGQTYLVRKSKDNLPEYRAENWKEINKKIDTIKKSIGQFRSGKVKESIDTWYKFPDAHMRLVFESYKKDADRQEFTFNEVLKKMGDNKNILVSYATWLYQNQRYKEAIPQFEKCINIAPHEDLFVYLGWCFNHLGQYPQAMGAFHQASIINPKKWIECINWMCHAACQMPSWDERAKMEIKDHLFKQADPKIKMDKLTGKEIKSESVPGSDA